MSLESPNKPRKIGEHFISEGLEISPIGGKLFARATYEYRGKYLSRRTMDRGYHINNGLFEKILEPLKGSYEIGQQNSKPEDRFIIERDGSVFTLGHTKEIDDRLAAKSKVSQEEKFRLFLRDLESSMQSYKE
jgi:hypothetical protein